MEITNALPRHSQREFDLADLTEPAIGPVPWYFRLGRILSRRKFRGGDRLLREARARGLLNRLAEYRLGNGVNLRVPIWRPCNEWDQTDIFGYESAFIAALSAAVCQLRAAVTLVDCGADIGTVSAHLVARCKNIRSVVAFEPNRAAFRVLADNLKALPVPAEARFAAVGNFRGRGLLVSPALDSSAHAMFVEPSATGPIVIERVDDLGLPPGEAAVIKIDVEGGESAVIEGARQTIREARDILVAFEAHPRVSIRLGVDPSAVMKQLLAIRPDVTFTIDTTPTSSVTADRPLFEQVPATRVYNIIAASSRS